MLGMLVLSAVAYDGGCVCGPVDVLQRCCVCCCVACGYAAVRGGCVTVLCDVAVMLFVMGAAGDSVWCVCVCAVVPVA